MVRPVLPIVSESMAESLKRMGFSDATHFCYKDGMLTEYQEDSVPAPSLQEVQAWIGRRKRLDVLVKDGMMRETAKCPTYNQALETGLRVAINFLGKKKRRRRKG